MTLLFMLRMCPALTSDRMRHTMRRTSHFQVLHVNGGLRRLRTVPPASDAEAVVQSRRDRNGQPRVYGAPEADRHRGLEPLDVLSRSRRTDLHRKVGSLLLNPWASPTHIAHLPSKHPDGPSAQLSHKVKQMLRHLYRNRTRVHVHSAYANCRQWRTVRRLRCCCACQLGPPLPLLLLRK